MLLRLLSSSRPIKRLVSVSYDALVIPLAIYLAIYFRVGESFSLIQPKLLTVVVITTAVTLVSFIKLGLYRAILRFMAHQAVITVVVCTFISALTLVTTAYFFQLTIDIPNRGAIELPRSTPFIYGCFTLVALGFPRMFIRTLVHLFLTNRRLMKSDDRESILIYGAGHTGYQIASSLMQARKYEVIAFIDDDEKLTNTTVRGVAVHSSDSVANLIKLYNVKTILLALGQTTKSNRSSIVEKLEKFEVKIQTVPTLEDLLYGQAHGQEIRDIEIEDLLGRDPIPPRKDLLDQCVRDKVVMVTGAGGSIGSELCRQILSESPSKLILFEQNEFNLYRVESELKQHFPNENLFSVLGTTLDRTLVSSVICNFNIQTIYHAAAYKHVPMVEKNIVEGVKNNALGTWECAKAAIEHSVENFVLISTDKAVRPTNIMGASKRLAELILQGLSKKESKTKLSMVRFGNVLGSSGSVVPLFKQQIAGGGPITVTHKNITRYFMTIPEAAQLVIQASAMSTGGDVFVLDMGEPIRIWDLAERMVRMSGLSVKSNTNPDGDIEIRQIGLRPGEKLYEELLVSNDVRGTEHPLIMRATEASLSWLETQKLIEELIQHCKDFNAVKLRELIANAPTHYSYDGINYDLLENQKEKIVSIDSAKLTRLRSGKQNTD